MSSMLNNLLAAFEKNKQDPFLRYGIAIEYRNAGDLDKALEFFLGVRQEFPDYIPNYYHFAQCLESLERKDDAIQAYNDGIEAAKKAGNMHALSELQRELNNLI